jgi:hypothetical protein
MLSQRAHEVLYESHAALRLVDQELVRLCNLEPGVAGTDPAATLEEVGARVERALDRLRDGRSALLRGAEASRVPHGSPQAEALVAEAAVILHDVEQVLLSLTALVDTPPSDDMDRMPTA